MKVEIIKFYEVSVVDDNGQICEILDRWNLPVEASQTVWGDRKQAEKAGRSLMRAVKESQKRMKEEGAG